MSVTSRPILILAALAIAAVALRFGLALQPPFDFAVMRQHHSALIAENVYYSSHPTAAPDWRRRVAADYVAQATIPEPIFVERMAALTYGITGHEDVRLPRLILGLCWIAGGLFLYAAVRRWSSEPAAIVAFVVHAFLPYSFRASVSLQPDTLAVLFTCAGLYGLARLGTSHAWTQVLLAALPAAAAILVRPMTACFLVPSALPLALRQGREYFPRKSTPGFAFALYVAVAMLPFLVYFAWRFTGDATYASRLSTTFAPSLLLDVGFYRGWARNVLMAFNFVTFLAIAGALVVPPGPMRFPLRAMWLGYLAYGVFFNLHISTHPYYQTIAVPMVAASVGVWAAWVTRSAGRLTRWLAPALTALLICAAFLQGTFASPPTAANRIADYEAIGEAVEHSSQVVFLSEDWGTPLRYHGGLAGKYWPTRFEIQMYLPLGSRGLTGSDASARWQELSAAAGGARYFVVTDLAELARQPDLQQLLTARFSLRKGTERYLVYTFLQ